jgi:hypothetical protein
MNESEDRKKVIKESMEAKAPKKDKPQIPDRHKETE